MKDLAFVEAIDVSIVMPCLDEAATIGRCVLRAQQALDALRDRHGLNGEVVVADNGSTDGSQAIARMHGAEVVQVPARGYGAALKGGFTAARGRFLVMGDSDCSYDFLESVTMVEALMDGADLCMGSRFLGEIKPGAMPWKNRYIGNPVLSGLLRLLFGNRISDSHCGLRALTRGAFERLKLSSNGMEFASEMVLKASLQKMRLAEVPVTLSPDGRGRPPHLKPVRDGLRHLFYMLMLCPRWLFLGPSVALASLGLALFAVLLSGPSGGMVRVGPFGFGDHWAVVASAALILAVQAMIFGLATMVVGHRDGYLPPSPRAAWLFGRSTLGTWLAAGMAVTLGGLLWAASITSGWISSDFGSLNELRDLLAAVTAIVVGMQACLGGFLLSIVAGNRMSHFAAA